MICAMSSLLSVGLSGMLSSSLCIFSVMGNDLPAHDE